MRKQADHTGSNGPKYLKKRLDTVRIDDERKKKLYRGGGEAKNEEQNNKVKEHVE